MDLCEVFMQSWPCYGELRVSFTFVLWLGCCFLVSSHSRIFPHDQFAPHPCYSGATLRLYTWDQETGEKIKRMFPSTLGTPVLLSWEDLFSPEARYFLVCGWYIRRDRAVFPPCSTKSYMVLLREVFLDYTTTGKYKHYHTVNTSLKSIAWWHLITTLISSIYWIAIIMTNWTLPSNMLQWRSKIKLQKYHAMLDRISARDYSIISSLYSLL